MVDENQLVPVKINRNNKKRFENIGYECNYEDIIMVPYKNYHGPNETKLEAICDNPKCQKTFFIRIGNYKNLQKREDKRTYCKECGHLKAEETMLKKYGNKCVFHVPEIQEKIKQTSLKNWGVDNPSKSKEFQKLRFKSNLEKYGSTSPFSDKNVQQKSKNILKEHYGVDNPSQSLEIQEKIRKSFYKNGTQKVSKQQQIFCDYFGVEPNYPVRFYNLDILFVEEKIDMEYNGGGHNLKVKIGDLTESQFTQLETYRKKQLYEEGWKIIILISPKNKILDKEVSLKLFEKCKEYFYNNNRHWIEIYIDEDIVVTSQFSIKLEDFIK